MTARAPRVLSSSISHPNSNATGQLWAVALTASPLCRRRSGSVALTPVDDGLRARRPNRRLALPSTTLAVILAALGARQLNVLGVLGNDARFRSSTIPLPSAGSP
ncbi:hypothetical protein C8039_00780 [Halogeometricum sp. wsp3]|nr:hypothetical protein C8039_00780 [Halogeometricum sp. wsp3]